MNYILANAKFGELKINLLPCEIRYVAQCENFPNLEYEFCYEANDKSKHHQTSDLVQSTGPVPILQNELHSRPGSVRSLGNG